MSLRCDSLYTLPKANLVPKWCRLVPTNGSWCQVVLGGTSWCELVLGGTSWCQAVLAGQCWYRLVEPGEIGNVGHNPCGSVQDCNELWQESVKGIEALLGQMWSRYCAKT